MKKVFVFIMSAILFGTGAFAQAPECCSWNYLHFMRETIYNVLDLTEQQSQYRDDAVKQNDNVYEEKFKELDKKSAELLLLKKSGVPKHEIKQQEQILQNIEKEIYKIWLEEYKVLEKSLTRSQKSKLSIIKKLVRQEYKRNSRNENYYKKNFRMPKFGGMTAQ